MKIGVLGGGQLGRMLALAGYPMGLRFKFYDPKSDACAGQVGELKVGAWDDWDALASFAADLDIVTYEWENVPAEAVLFLSQRVKVHPNIKALQTAQDRLYEKQLFERVGLSVPKYVAVESLDELLEAIKVVGLPCVLKTRRMGYDGKGQLILRSEEDLSGAMNEVGNAPCLVESYVEFDRELSVIAVCSVGGVTCYSLIENEHKKGILQQSIAPSPNVSSALQDRANKVSELIARELGYVGVFAVELFQVRDELFGNEMAPRVHNSGHWTIEGAVTSQFENHLRCILEELPGPTENRFRCVMKNLIGPPDADELLRVSQKRENVFFHDYGKEPRPGRKYGHYTTIGPLS